MDLEMVFNELSIETPTADIQTARQLMSHLIGTLTQATKSGVQRVLRTHNDINSIELAPNYPISRWRNDNEVSREERSFFRTLTSKAPFWIDVAEEIKNDFDLSEVKYQGKPSLGLTFAIVSEALAISLLTENRWDCSRLQVEIVQVDETETLIDQQIEIIHASRSHHLLEHAKWIQSRIQIIANNGLELWSFRHKLFPNLEFCESVADSLQGLDCGNPMLRQVWKRLMELENYCKIWTMGSFDFKILPSKATPESESTLKQFKQKLTFQCPDGQNRLFSWHVRMTPGAWRLYFDPELRPGKMVIGYIGKKIQ